MPNGVGLAEVRTHFVNRAGGAEELSKPNMASMSHSWTSLVREILTCHVCIMQWSPMKLLRFSCCCAVHATVLCTHAVHHEVSICPKCMHV